MNIDDLLSPDGQVAATDAARTDAQLHEAERAATRVCLRLDTWVKAVELEGAVLDPPIEVWEAEVVAAADLLRSVAHEHAKTGLDPEAIADPARRDDLSVAGLLTEASTLLEQVSAARATVRETP